MDQGVSNSYLMGKRALVDSTGAVASASGH